MAVKYLKVDPKEKINSENKEIINLKGGKVIEDEETIKICLPRETRYKIGNTTFIVSHVYENNGKTLYDKVDEFLELQDKSLENSETAEFSESKEDEFFKLQENEESVELLNLQESKEIVQLQEKSQKNEKSTKLLNSQEGEWVVGLLDSQESKEIVQLQEKSQENGETTELLDSRKDKSSEFQEKSKKSKFLSPSKKGLQI